VKKKFLLRISPGLWDEINRWADQDFRSVNGQIEFLLQEAVRRKGRALQEAPEESSQEHGNA
jgi:hypothetical protein